MPRYDTCNRHPWNPANGFGACWECDPSDYAHAPAGRLELVKAPRPSRQSMDAAPTRLRRARECDGCGDTLATGTRGALCGACRVAARPKGACVLCGADTRHVSYAFCSEHRRRGSIDAERARGERRRRKEGRAIGKGKQSIPARIICVRGVCRTPGQWAERMGIRANTLIQRIRRTSIMVAMKGAT